jgi:hypothetical protein
MDLLECWEKIVLVANVAIAIYNFVDLGAPFVVLLEVAPLIFGLSYIMYTAGVLS